MNSDTIAALLWMGGSIAGGVGAYLWGTRRRAERSVVLNFSGVQLSDGTSISNSEFTVLPATQESINEAMDVARHWEK